jgi:hypothetical protein
MTAIHKKFEEKKQEEIQKVEERFMALLNEGNGEVKPPQAKEEKEEKRM